MHAQEADVLASIASAVNSSKASLKAVGSVGRNDGVQVTRATHGSRLAFGSGPSWISSISSGYSTRARRASASRRPCSTWTALPCPPCCGSFHGRRTVANYADKSQYVGLDSTSEELLRQVQMLLLSFGIKSKLYAGRRGKTTMSLLRTPRR